jgi:hypothetical protein
MITTKKCGKCLRELALDNFRKYKSGKNNGYFQSYCKSCDRAYKQKHRVKYLFESPWIKYYTYCYNRTHYNKSTYFRRGILLLMTIDDFKELWFRDKAYQMKNPSIDRIYGDVGYEKWNCRYIELTDNNRRKRIKLKGIEKLSEK